MELINQAYECIKYIHNFQGGNVLFLDLADLFANGRLISELVSFALHAMRIESNYKILTLESRGFLLSTEVSRQTGAKQVLVRKVGKTNNPKTFSYKKEYGYDTMEFSLDMIKAGDKCIIVDDIYATGGSSNAVIKALEEIGATYCGTFVLIDLLLADPTVKNNLYAIMDLKLAQNHLSYHLQGPGRAFMTPKLFSHASYLKVSPIALSNNNSSLSNNNSSLSNNNSSLSNNNSSLHNNDNNNHNNNNNNHNNNNNKKIILYHPTMESLIEELGVGYVPHSLRWDRFKNGDPNFKIPTDLKNKKIKFLMSSNYNHLLDQIQILRALGDQQIKSLKIYCPYFPYATMERKDVKGVVATGSTIAQMIASSLPICKDGPPTLVIYDIHATPVIEYFGRSVYVQNISLMEQFAKTLSRQTIVVFPDDGSKKRFGQYFKYHPVICCAKSRGKDDKRTIVIETYERIKDLIKTLQEADDIYIVDDMVRTGGTLLETMKVLAADYQISSKKISLFTVHADFVEGSLTKFESADIKKFIVYNTNPMVAEKLVKVPEIFTVLPLNVRQSDYLIVASTNQRKIQAAYEIVTKLALLKPSFQILSIGVNSDVHNQPIGFEEGKTGSLNRLMKAKELFKKVYQLTDSKCLVVSPQNYLVFSAESTVLNADQSWYDVPIITMSMVNEEKVTIYTGQYLKQETKYVEASLATKQVQTAGSFVEKEFNLVKDEWFDFLHPGCNRIEQMKMLTEYS